MKPLVGMGLAGVILLSGCASQPAPTNISSYNPNRTRDRDVAGNMPASVFGEDARYAGKVAEIGPTEDEFNSFISDGKRVVMHYVEFDPNFKKMNPIFSQVASEMRGVNFGRFDALRYAEHNNLKPGKIQAPPRNRRFDEVSPLIAFYDYGQLVHQNTGVMPAWRLKAMVEEVFELE